MIAQVLTVVATVFAGLGAGVFYAFTTGVMPGFARSDDHAFVVGMRAINRAVLNPLFLGAIFAAPLAILAAVPAAFAAGAVLSGGLLVVALLLTVAGVLVVTIRGNVPLNDQLETSVEREAATRAAFERPWVRLNAIRTVCSTLTLVLCAVAIAALPA